MKTLTPVERTYVMADLEAAIFALYNDEPFLGTVGGYIAKDEDPDCSTMYVSAGKNGGLKLGYNLNFFGEQDTHHKRQGLLKHEYLHVVLCHITDRYPTTDVQTFLFNVAADLVVNYYCAHEKGGNVNPAKHLPKNCFFAGVFPDGCIDKKFGELIKSFPVDKELEWYYDRLLKFVEQEKKQNPNYSPGNGMETIDDHGQWKNISDEDREILRQHIDGAIREGVTRAQEKNSWGSLPQSFQGYIQKYLQKEVDWRPFVSQFFKRARSSSYTSTPRRLNKRLPYLMPGSRKKTESEFAVFVDQSGSVSDGEISQMFAEITGLSGDMNKKIDVYNFDTSVDVASHQKWKAGSNNKWQRTRSGGTNFNGVRDFVLAPENVKKWTGVIIMTDGYAAEMGSFPNHIKVLWVITETGSKLVVREGDLVIQFKKKATK